MQMQDAIRFSISQDKIVCNTPECGVSLADFLQVLRRSVDTYRARGTFIPQACSLPVNKAEECTS